MPEAGPDGDPRPPGLDGSPGGAPGGTVRPVLLYPDPRLRDICAPAGEMTFPELRGLVADLFATLYAAKGRGLAAPQIGVPRRVFVMDEGWKTGAPTPLAVIDPRIVWRSGNLTRAVEECLSIPGHPVEVQRPAELRLAFFDLDGVACELALSGAAARIAQHELDHLDGVLIVDVQDDAAPERPGKRAQTAARRAAPGAPAA